MLYLLGKWLIPWISNPLQTEFIGISLSAALWLPLDWIKKLIAPNLGNIWPLAFHIRFRPLERSWKLMGPGTAPVIVGLMFFRWNGIFSILFCFADESAGSRPMTFEPLLRNRWGWNNPWPTARSLRLIAAVQAVRYLMGILNFFSQGLLFSQSSCLTKKNWWQQVIQIVQNIF